MKQINGLTVRNALACAVVVAMGYAGLASAADPPDFTVDFDPGQACAFELRIEGRVVFTIDTAGVFELQRTSGRSIDICAALS